jgi:hypothetical protein
MATNNPIPLFLSDPIEVPEQAGSLQAWERAVIASRILKTSILAATATAIGIAILLVGNPVALVANVTALWVDKSAPQPGPDPSTPAIQSIAGTQDLTTTTTDAPARDEIAAAVEPADQSQAEISQPPNEALFKQFQAWAAEEDAQALVGPVQPVQDPQAQLVQTTPEQVRPVQKQQQVRPVQRAKIVKNAQTQDRSVQNAQAPKSRLVQSTGRLN